MAKTIHSGPAAARNSYSLSSPMPVLGDEDLVHGGLVHHALLTPTVQVQILLVVDETGSASIGDIVDTLPGHPDPVGAVFALITAGVLEIVSPGIVDSHTIVTRTGLTEACPPDAPLAPAPDSASPGAGTQAPADEGGVADPHGTDEVAAVLPPDLEIVPTNPLHPIIVTGSGECRASFRHLECLQRPGVYILLRGWEAYVGYGADVGARIMNSRQMPGGPPDHIIAIVDGENRLTPDDARAFERMLWTLVAGDADYDLLNGVPDGAPILPDRYAQLHLFGAQIALALRQNNLLFTSGSARQHLAGPRTEPGRLGRSRRIDHLPPGKLMELRYCGLMAIAAEQADGTWLLLQGSDIRIPTVPSANSSASFQRAAWLHAGIMEFAVDGMSYVLKRDMLFASGSAVSHFVSGSKGFGLSSWTPLDPDDLIEPNDLKELAL